MLVLTVKIGKGVNINGEQVVVTVKEIVNGRVKLAIEADKSIPIRRVELAGKNNDVSDQ